MVAQQTLYCKEASASKSLSLMEIQTYQCQTLRAWMSEWNECILYGSTKVCIYDLL